MLDARSNSRTMPRLRHETSHTAGRAIADTLAEQLSRAELIRYDKALHSVAYCCDEIISNPHILPRGGGDVGISIADHMQAGDAIIVFADANPQRGYLTGGVPLSDLFEASTQTRLRFDRLNTANTAARRIGHDVKLSRRLPGQSSRRTAEDRHRDLIVIAANVFPDDGIETLRLGVGGVPVLSLIGDTRASGITSGRFVCSLATLPGTWLGTTPPAGRC